MLNYLCQLYQKYTILTNMKFWYRMKQLILLLVDILLFYFSLWLALAIRNLSFTNTEQINTLLSIFKCNYCLFINFFMAQIICNHYKQRKIESQYFIFGL